MPDLKNFHLINKLINTGYTMLIIILLSAVVGLILAFPVMWLWNYVFGSILNINVFQAWALNVLLGILFGKGPIGSKTP